MFFILLRERRSVPALSQMRDVPVLHKPATTATVGRVKKAGVCVKLWLAGIYFLVHAIFVASKLWIWQQFKTFSW